MLRQTIHNLNETTRSDARLANEVRTASRYVTQRDDTLRGNEKMSCCIFAVTRRQRNEVQLLPFLEGWQIY